MLNGRGYPDTMNPEALANSFDGQSSQPIPTIITAQQGQRILLRISSLSTTSFHTLTVQGIPMQVIGEGSRQRRSFYTTNAVTLGGGQSMEVILDTAGVDGLVGTADDVPAGTYYLYTTNLDHLANREEDYGGMMTEIVIQ
jgi:hypothetical protein